jgi:hypothetical protein
MIFPLGINWEHKYVFALVIKWYLRWYQIRSIFFFKWETFEIFWFGTLQTSFNDKE